MYRCRGAFESEAAVADESFTNAPARLVWGSAVPVVSRGFWGSKGTSNVVVSAARSPPLEDDRDGGMRMGDTSVVATNGNPDDIGLVRVRVWKGDVENTNKSRKQSYYFVSRW